MWFFFTMFGKRLGAAYPCWGARCHGIFLSAITPVYVLSWNNPFLTQQAAGKPLKDLLPTFCTHQQGKEHTQSGSCSSLPLCLPHSSSCDWHCFIFYPPSLAFVSYFTFTLLYLSQPKITFSSDFQKFLNAFLSVLACQHFRAAASSQAHLSLPCMILPKSQHTGLGTHPCSTHAFFLCLLCMSASYIHVFCHNQVSQWSYTFSQAHWHSSLSGWGTCALKCWTTTLTMQRKHVMALKKI